MTVNRGDGVAVSTLNRQSGDLGLITNYLRFIVWSLLYFLSTTVDFQRRVTVVKLKKSPPDYVIVQLSLNKMITCCWWWYSGQYILNRQCSGCNSILLQFSTDVVKFSPLSQNQPRSNKFSEEQRTAMHIWNFVLDLHMASTITSRSTLLFLWLRHLNLNCLYYFACVFQGFNLHATLTLPTQLSFYVESSSSSFLPSFDIYIYFVIKS